MVKQEETKCITNIILLNSRVKMKYYIKRCSKCTRLPLASKDVAEQKFLLHLESIFGGTNCYKFRHFFSIENHRYIRIFHIRVNNKFIVYRKYVTRRYYSALNVLR